MTPEQLIEGHKWAVDTFYSSMPIMKRILLNAPWSVTAKAFSWWVNWHYQKVKNIYDTTNYDKDLGQMPEPIDRTTVPSIGSIAAGNTAASASLRVL